MLNFKLIILYFLCSSCINGYLKSRIRILVTHQTQYLHDADQIILLNDGEVKAKGTYNDIKASGLESILEVLDHTGRQINAANSQNELNKDMSVLELLNDETKPGDLVLETDKLLPTQVLNRVSSQLLNNVQN